MTGTTNQNFKYMTRDFLPVSMWAREDIPTCKMMDHGMDILTTAELISIIIGSGSKKENCVELARRILAKNENCLGKLSKCTVRDLSQMYGVGEGKAAKILAALELGKRRQQEIVSSSPEISTAPRIYNYMIPCMQDLDVEEFWALYLNQNYRVVKRTRISHGGISEVIVDIRIVMREAILNNATILAVCHNHPSGSIRPSKCDDELTKGLSRACEVMRLKFLDHVIITDGAYYSYHEEGRVQSFLFPKYVSGATMINQILRL